VIGDGDFKHLTGWVDLQVRIPLNGRRPGMAENLPDKRQASPGFHIIAAQWLQVFKGKKISPFFVMTR